MIKNNKTGDPYINIWFGNFYKPAFDDKNFIVEGTKLLKKLGFNSISLDSKAWEDFRDRYEGKEASPYVEMQEFMIEEFKRQGISHEFLALYLNGDNLYPNIRFSKPIYGESTTNIHGEDGKWYKYWSEKARVSMVDHVSGLMDLYSENHSILLVDGEVKNPICSMWDPIAAPSFDEDGIKRYVEWLEKQYKDINELNRKYDLNKECFNDLEPEDYWFGERFKSINAFTSDDVLNGNPSVYVFSDNQKWKNHELNLFFKDMKSKLKSINKNFYLRPVMAQWGYFFNIDGSMLENVGFANLWDTSVRGIDIYDLSKHVDSASFISVPVTPYGDPCAYVTSCNNSMLRNMNRGRDFLGGIYWGRFLYNHIYNSISPCEIIGSIVASNATGYISYGMCGLDDGGVLHRMEDCFNESLEVGNNWAKNVIPMLNELEEREIAILFPKAMSLFEIMEVEGNKERRLDTLGFYKACADLGCEADVVDMNILLAEDFANYKVLIIPNDDCYKYAKNIKFEDKLKEWVLNGGVVIHSPSCDLSQFIFNINKLKCNREPIIYDDVVMVESTDYCYYKDGKSFANYKNGNIAISRNTFSRGEIFSFGFDYGYSYVIKKSPHVPLEEKNNELYPLQLMNKNILQDILEEVLGKSLIYNKDIEIGKFSNGKIIINHTSYPYIINEQGKKYFQYNINEALLLPHSAVFIENN
ncbi:MAG: alpha-amylase family protein [Lachnospirales bacterium]